MYLNCKTYFSYRYGTFSTEELVASAVEVGAHAVALTNINSTGDHFEFLEFCTKAGIKGVLGVEIRNDDQFLYLLLAKSLQGVREINAFLSLHLQAASPFPHRPQCTKSLWVVYPLGIDQASLLANEVIGIKPAELNKLYGQQLLQDKYVVLQPVTYKDKRSYNLHRLLRAIDKNVILSKQGKSEIAEPTETFLSPSALLERFKHHSFMVTNTLRLFDTCSYDFQFGTDKNKKTFSATKEDDRCLLEKLALEGLYNRYGRKNKEAKDRVVKELKIINDLHFNAYFLITWDVIRYAQNRGFFHVGRGSGANSIVAYCLQITDVNPIDLDLYFERFLNPFRTSPPDFDIDFSWTDRDEVIDYIFKRYGKEHVALLGMYSTFKRDAAIRELGKVFGLPKREIDSLVNDRSSTFKEDKIQRQIHHYASMMQGFPNYLSIHPGGMLISEEPIFQYTALELPPKGFATAQIDMFLAEKVGLYKLDILSQRGLGHIKEATKIIKENKKVTVDIHRVEDFKKDKQVAAQIRKADTIGCFYIESPAMRHLLKKLRCDDYITLVAASSIIRPGVSQSGMMREYIHRFHHPDSFQYLHPKMEELLQETYGVMVYQEDVIKVAHHFANMDLADADVLRRAMSGKYRGKAEMERLRETYFKNCKEIGHPDNIAAEVWRQMESFSGYSFSKAHSASFAVESYQSLYLKTYFPMEFMVAVINNFGGFYSRELYFHELKRTGARVHPPCVNKSDELTRIEGEDVYVGFIHLDSMETETVRTLLEERQVRGDFTSLQDFIERTGIGIEQINILIRIGAFRFTGQGKKSLLWQANFLQKKVKERMPVGAELFESVQAAFALPTLEEEPYGDYYDEIELLGFTLKNVYDLVEAPSRPFITSNKFEQYLGKQVEALGYFIDYKHVPTKNGSRMYFGTFLDANGGWIDSVHFPQSVDRYPLKGKGFYHLKGKVVEEFGVYSLEVGWMQKVGVKQRE